MLFCALVLGLCFCTDTDRDFNVYALVSLQAEAYRLGVSTAITLAGDVRVRQLTLFALFSSAVVLGKARENCL